MKQDNDILITIINNVLEEPGKTITYGSLIKEIVKLLNNNNTLDDELENQLLNELYKFTQIGNTITSIDPRGDSTLKYNALNEIKKSIENNNLSKDSLEYLKKMNDMCLDYFLNPLILRKKQHDYNWNNFLRKWESNILKGQRYIITLCSLG